MNLGAWGLSDGSIAASGESKQLLKVADEVWIATAFLHRENPQAADFSVEEIARRAEREALAGGLRASFRIHVAQHCVANRPPHPAHHRMLFETSPGHRRLFREGDPHHAARQKGKITPDPLEMPYGYGVLLTWYRYWSAAPPKASLLDHPLLTLQGFRKPVRSRKTAAGSAHRSRRSGSGK